MKTLIEKSIKVRGIGNPNQQTIFNSEGPKIKYYNIEKISGRTLSVEYNYTENDNELSASLPLVIPTGLNEMEVKQFILESIGAELNK